MLLGLGSVAANLAVAQGSSALRDAPARLGVLLLFAAFSLWSGGLYGRIVGIVGAGLSAIAALLSIPAYPLWSLAIFAIDIVIIHQIATRGTEGRRAY